MRRPTAALLVAFALYACSSPKPPEVENVPLPSGMTVKMLGLGPAPAWEGKQPLGMRYQPGVSMDDSTALHKEALEIWRFFRFQADAKNDQSAVLTAQENARRIDFRFKRIGGTWYEVDASGKPVSAPPPRLNGAVKALSWMLGTWTCNFTFAADKFQTVHPAILINEADTGGTTVDQTYSESVGPGALLGETHIGFDSGRNTWFRRGRQTPDATEYDEAPGAYSRDMTFTGTTQLSGKPPMAIRKRIVVVSDALTRATTQARIGGKWMTVGKGDCKKT